MKKMWAKIAAGAVVIGLSTGPASADKMAAIEPYQGGFELWSTDGWFCGMNLADPGSNILFSAALGAKANGWDVTLYPASRAGWGTASTWGSQTCAALYTSTP